jgi:ABC-2 type transport system ATP-binding protein
MQPTSSGLAVATSNLTKAYGSDAGVFDLDLAIEPGTIVGFIGPSGSGKTTTVHLLIGITARDSGTVEVLGEDPARFSRETRARIGYMPQDAILYPDLTLRQNLDFAASLYGVPLRRKELIERLVDFVELEGAIDRLPADASGGEKRRAMLASTLMHDPDMLFLDEPTAGVDPVLRRKFWDRFEELAAEGKTLLVTTQYVGEAAYCDYVAVLARGRILTVDTPEGLRRVAYGGEMIEVSFEHPPESALVATMRELPGVQSIEWADTNRVRLVVDDAEPALPAINSWAEKHEVRLNRSETYLPPFDDVFVELVSRLDQPEEAGVGG